MIRKEQYVSRGKSRVQFKKKRILQEKEMYVSKIDLMHEKFGKLDNETVCAECRHFLREEYHGKTYRKCRIYGFSNAESTDWRSGYIACGLFNKNFESDRPIIEFAHYQDEQIPGQLSFDDLLKGDTDV